VVLHWPLLLLIWVLIWTACGLLILPETEHTLLAIRKWFVLLSQQPRNAIVSLWLEFFNSWVAIGTVAGLLYAAAFVPPMVGYGTAKAFFVLGNLLFLAKLCVEDKLHGRKKGRRSIGHRATIIAILFLIFIPLSILECGLVRNFEGARAPTLSNIWAASLWWRQLPTREQSPSPSPSAAVISTQPSAGRSGELKTLASPTVSKLAARRVTAPSVPRPVPQPIDDVTKANLDLLNRCNTLAIAFGKWVSEEETININTDNSLEAERKSGEWKAQDFDNHYEVTKKYEWQTRMNAYNNIYLPTLQECRRELAIEVPNAMHQSTDYAHPYNLGGLNGISTDFRHLVEAYEDKLVTQGVIKQPPYILTFGGDIRDNKSTIFPPASGISPPEINLGGYHNKAEKNSMQTGKINFPPGSHDNVASGNIMSAFSWPKYIDGLKESLIHPDPTRIPAPRPAARMEMLKHGLDISYWSTLPPVDRRKATDAFQAALQRVEGAGKDNDKLLEVLKDLKENPPDCLPPSWR
jgi:hypothetical protein